MWSGWRRGPEARRKVRRSLRNLKALRAPDLRRMRLPHLKDLHLRDVHLPDLHLPGLRLPELHAPDIDWRRGRVGSRAAALWPAVLAAAGAGVAVWSWNEWARGRVGAQAGDGRAAGLAPSRSPSEAQRQADRAGGVAGAAAPESIMTHAPSPDDPGVLATEVGETVPGPARAVLDESLAVQASAEPAAGAGRTGA